MNYKLIPDGECVRLEIKDGTVSDHFSPNRNLLSVLCNGAYNTSIFNNDGRLMFECWEGLWSDRLRVYLYDLAYCCYCGAVHVGTLADDLQKYRDWKRIQGLTIDHLDSNIHNNTALNLSLMDLSTNVSKRSFPAGFVGPYALSMAHVGGEYRIQLSAKNTEHNILQGLLDSVIPGRFTMGDDAGISALHFLCPDAEDLVECLKHLYNTRLSWCNPGETARAYKKKHRGIDHLAADIKRSLSAQKTLAEMDRSEFQLFKTETETPILVGRAN